MNAVVIGCGRVGSSVAKGLAADGWDVSVVDENEGALGRLGLGWRGGFVVGHGMDVTVLERAGVADADAAVVATNGDNTNIVIGRSCRSATTSAPWSCASSTLLARRSTRIAG